MSKRLGAIVAPTAALLSGADRAVVTGRVFASQGQPVEHATAMVYAAGVKTGYSTYCPTCYADCGKRTLTAADGAFTISSLAPGLWFRLLVVREGHAPIFVQKVDPAQGAPVRVVLNLRAAVDDPDIAPAARSAPRATAMPCGC